MAAKFGAGLRLVDFRRDPTAACTAINSWVSDQTEARIPKILDKLDAATRLVLVNAIYMTAPWNEPFQQDLTTNAPFSTPDHRQVTVPTMSVGLDQATYASGPGWQAVELPYVNHLLAMTIVVPDELAQFDRGLDATRFDQIVAGLHNAHVDLTLPRFKVESASNLTSVLSTMGMPLAFDPDKADFSGMTTQERLFALRVVHQAEISVDETGTVGSAATVVEATAGYERDHVTLHVDKPFLFAIRDTTTGAILFLGRVTDPSA